MRSRTMTENVIAAQVARGLLLRERGRCDEKQRGRRRESRRPPARREPRACAFSVCLVATFSHFYNTPCQPGHLDLLYGISKTACIYSYIVVRAWDGAKTA